MKQPNALKIELINEVHKSALQTLSLDNEHEDCRNETASWKIPKESNLGYPSMKASDWCYQMESIKDVSPRESTESPDKIEERDIVYLDDIKEKAEPESYCDYEPVILSVNSKGVGRITSLCCDTSAYQPLPQEPSKMRSGKRKSTVDDNKQCARTQASRNTSQNYDGGILQDMQQNVKREDISQFKQSHVHPKLPHYEELEAKFKNLNSTGRQ